MKQYMTPEELAEEFNQSRTHIFKMLNAMRKYVGDGQRYGRYDLAGSRKSLVVRTVSYLDYMTYRAELEEKGLAKHVPPFNAAEAEKQLGINQPPVTNVSMTVDANEVAQKLFEMFTSSIVASAVNS
ncbi:MAG: hypothetical protein IKI12_02730 [Lachnospiraceae bacterium]|nr:hypothetical protein [Lachnospiraceae bacterium]